MPLVTAAPSGAARSRRLVGQASFEVDRFYQPGLLDAAELWLWDAAGFGSDAGQELHAHGRGRGLGSRRALLEVSCRAARSPGNAVDHHVSVSVNGVLVGEAQFAGKAPYRMSLSVPAGLLREGANELQLTNVGDTGVASLVFLDRFTVSYPQLSSLGSGAFEGTWSESGSGDACGRGERQRPAGRHGGSTGRGASRAG